jgi:hypothetical protein
LDDDEDDDDVGGEEHLLRSSNEWHDGFFGGVRELWVAAMSVNDEFRSELSLLLLFVCVNNSRLMSFAK